MIYYLTHIVSGRNRSFAAPDWASVEADLLSMGLDPDDWGISAIMEIEADD